MANFGCFKEIKLNIIAHISQIFPKKILALSDIHTWFPQTDSNLANMC